MCTLSICACKCVQMCICEYMCKHCVCVCTDRGFLTSHPVSPAPRASAGPWLWQVSIKEPISHSGSPAFSPSPHRPSANPFTSSSSLSSLEDMQSVAQMLFSFQSLFASLWAFPIPTANRQSGPIILPWTLAITSLSAASSLIHPGFGLWINSPAARLGAAAPLLEAAALASARARCGLAFSVGLAFPSRLSATPSSPKPLPWASGQQIVPRGGRGTDWIARLGTKQAASAAGLCRLVKVIAQVTASCPLSPKRRPCHGEEMVTAVPSRYLALSVLGAFIHATPSPWDALPSSPIPQDPAGPPAREGEAAS